MVDDDLLNLLREFSLEEGGYFPDKKAQKKLLNELQKIKVISRVYITESHENYRLTVVLRDDATFDSIKDLQSQMYEAYTTAWGSYSIPSALRSFQRSSGNNAVDSDRWTGIEPGLSRLTAVKALVPTVMNALEALILELDLAGGNWGEPLSEREEAIAVLRKLHIALGEILQLADSGSLESGLYLGLAGEALSFANRAMSVLKEDPIRCAIIAMAAATATFVAQIGGVGPAVAGLSATIALVPAKGK